MIYVITLTHKVNGYIYFEFTFKRKSNPYYKYKEILSFYNFEDVRNILEIMKDHCVDKNEAFLIKEEEIKSNYHLVYLEILDYKKYLMEIDPFDGDMTFDAFIYVNFKKGLDIVQYLRDEKLKQILK